MAEQFKNLASTTLDGAIDDSVETITVASAMGFTGGDFRILVDSEIMKVTAVSGLDLTVARGAGGDESEFPRQRGRRQARLDGRGAGRPRPGRSRGPGRLRQQAGGGRARPPLPADRWHLHRARQRLGLGEVRPDVADDAPASLGLPDLGESRLGDHRGQQRGDLVGDAVHLRYQCPDEGEVVSHSAVHGGDGSRVSAFSQLGELLRCRALHPRQRIGQAAMLWDLRRRSTRSPATVIPAPRDRQLPSRAGREAATSTWSNRTSCGSSTRTTTPTARFRFRWTAVRGRRSSASPEPTT